MSKTRGCGVIIIDDNNKILMGQRVKSKDKLQWCIPGGKIEEGETPEEGAVREVFEECGLIIEKEDLELIHVEEGKDTYDYTFAVTDFIGEVKDNPEEMINFKWFMPHELYDIDKENDMFPPTFNSLTYYSVKNLEKLMNKDNNKDEIILSRECSESGDKLVIIERNNGYALEYIISEALCMNNEKLFCTGEHALSAIISYYEKYYNEIKHFLYPSYPYPQHKFEEYKESNYKLFNSIEKKNKHITNHEEFIKACINDYENSKHY